MMTFEKKLKLLFDAQAFFDEPRLKAAINSDSIRLLSDDETESLFAAGDLFAAEGSKKNGEA
ncbi:MAG: hypothetical protein FWH17_09465 [Oscillospiraceae bacterium]|nr:hypothetical protein [Oscillospiraceae bacterium]